MREVIRIDGKKESEKPVELTHVLTACYAGWVEGSAITSVFEKIVYLGNCQEDGDMFACYIGGSIHIYKGHLNSGKY